LPSMMTRLSFSISLLYTTQNAYVFTHELFVLK
jgi:hypothetical protein